ncbi:plastocyanin [Alicyclobacillus curvatus]|nr:plastocyanin [Alicyclobacillus curvatus]
MKRYAVLIPTLLIGISAVGLGLNAHKSFAASLPTAPSANTSSTPTNVEFAGMMGGYSSAVPGTGYNSNVAGSPGMMGQYGGGGASTESGAWSGAMGSMMGGGVSRQGTELTMSQANHDMESSLARATVDKANNSITYTGDSVRIVVFGGAMSDNKTGPAEKFVIGGLVNPTLHVSKGANVTFELVNEDSDMAHGLEVSTAGPPYGYMSMMQGGIYSGSVVAPIPEADGNNVSMATTSFTASQSGTFYYLCQYPGHAAKGMYGKIIIG